MNESYLVTVLDLVEKMPFDALVRKHLIPWATDSEGQAKDSLIDFILNHWNSRYPSESWARLISNHPLVPISSCPTTGKKTYQCLVHLVKPGSILSQLYFEHEGVFPERSFYQKHDHALTACGMRSEVTWADVLDRIQYFSKCGANLEELEAKIRCLFDTSLSLNKTPNEYTLQLIRSLKWLPGTATITSPLGLLSPKTCRESDLSAVTDFVLGTTKFKPGINWKKILGWDKRVDSGLLLSQLDICIEGCLHDKIHQVLSYIQPDDYPSLRERKCILGSRKQYLSAESSILPDSLLTRYPMAPFLDEVDSVFATKHSDLIKALEIKKKPSLKDILRVQKDVQALTTILSESYLRVIVSSLQIATRLYKASELTTILVPDTEGVLRNLSDIVHGDRNTTGDIAAFHFTHPAISEEIVQKLDIENSLARATRLAIEFEDEDEDEYTPREKLTTIISDTLCRYPIESTFNEYLANADDCKATKMSWVLDCCDEGPYESTELLTPDLKSMQGPALFAHNDGGQFLSSLPKRPFPTSWFTLSIRNFSSFASKYIIKSGLNLCSFP